MLIGPQGTFLRRFYTLGAQSTQIAQAVTWLKDNFRLPLQVEELAHRVNMATSTFHRHFKEVTSLSPLQFHKRLRLFEAHRLMLSGHTDAATAGLSVGYESPTQFSREYKRMFGEPPHRNMQRMKKRQVQG
jgi:transcriptional regulator GlxA family with amidase domain